MFNENHTKKEIDVFTSFAENSELPIDLRSIEKRPESEPDILCRIKKVGKTAFELVEIQDPDFAEAFTLDYKSSKLLYSFHDSLPTQTKSEFDALFMNASIFVNFSDGLNLRDRNKVIPKLFKFLSKLGESYVGKVENLESEFGNKITKINILRGKYKGPCFDSMKGGFLNNPTIDRIKSKIDKISRGIYTTDFPIEILGYMYNFPLFHEDSWETILNDYLDSITIPKICRRIWIYDYHKKKVLYEYENTNFHIKSII